GSSTLTTNGSPYFVPGATYYLGLQNTNGSSITVGVEVDFHLLSTTPPIIPITISNIIHTNGGFLLIWYAPTNDLFQVQWPPSLSPTSWSTFTNVVSFHTFIDPTNSEFESFDDGSQTGGFVGPTRFYRLILLNSAPLTNGVPSTNNSIAPNGLA